jgi:hypothetical protein
MNKMRVVTHGGEEHEKMRGALYAIGYHELVLTPSYSTAQDVTWVFDPRSSEGKDVNLYSELTSAARLHGHLELQEFLDNVLNYNDC